MSPRTPQVARYVFICLILCLIVGYRSSWSATTVAAADPIRLTGAFYQLGGNPFRVGGGGPSGPTILAEPDSQWAMQKIEGPAALSSSNGGQGVVVAVVDTGVTLNHSYLQGHFTSARRNFVPGRAADDVSDVPDGTTNTGVGHGTFIAGLIRQVAPNALIMPVRVLNGDAIGTDVQVAAGVRFAADNGARIINLSLGGTQDSSLLDSAIDYAVKRGVVVVASAGNQNVNKLEWPANYSNALAVVASDSNDHKTFFSNYGGKADVSAPGINLYSTYSNGAWTWGSGTSFAAALVSGEAALVRAAYPSLSVSGLSDRIKSKSISIKALNPTYGDKLGKGRIDVYLALQP